MSFFKASTKAEDVKQGGSNHITSSGVYPVTVLAAIVNVSKNKSQTVDLFVDHQDQQQIIYGNIRVTNNDGTPNKIGAKVFNQLMIIADLESVADPVEAELPIGKGGAEKTCAVLEELSDIDVLMRVQMEYGVYKGSITEKKIVKAFFRASDKATAEEIVNGTEPGKGYEREMKYVDNVTYNDGLTPEAVAAWIAGGRQEGTGGAAPAATAAPSFGKRRFGKDKG